MWIAIASLGAVAAMAMVDLERTAPGPLSAVHCLALRDAKLA